MLKENQKKNTPTWLEVGVSSLVIIVPYKVVSLVEEPY